MKATISIEIEVLDLDNDKQGGLSIGTNTTVEGSTRNLRVEDTIMLYAATRIITEAAETAVTAEKLHKVAEAVVDEFENTGELH